MLQLFIAKPIEFLAVRTISDKITDLFHIYKEAKKVLNHLKSIESYIAISLIPCTKRLEIEGLQYVVEKQSKKFDYLKSQVLPIIRNQLLFYSGNLLCGWYRKKISYCCESIHDKLILLHYHAKLSEYEFISNNSTVFNQFLPDRLIELDELFEKLTTTNLPNSELDKLQIFDRRYELNERFRVESQYKPFISRVLN